MSTHTVNAGRPAYFHWHGVVWAIKIILLFVALGSWIAIQPARFSFPDVADYLPAIYLICLSLLVLMFLGTLLFRRWKQIPSFLVILLAVLLPFYGPENPPRWLYVAAFRRHAEPIDKYLSQCRLIEFVESGKPQRVGVCERLPFPGNDTLTIIYDSTGELSSPASQRTPEWTEAMGHFTPSMFLTRSEGRAELLFGSFYEIFIRAEEHDGAGDDD